MTGNVPNPKALIKTNPSAGRVSVTQYVRARNESPQGKTPFKDPSVNVDKWFFCRRNFENKVFKKRLKAPRAFVRIGTLIIETPVNPITRSEIPNNIEIKF